MTLALAAALDPSTIGVGQTSVLTVTRSGSSPITSETTGTYSTSFETDTGGWTLGTGVTRTNDLRTKFDPYAGEGNDSIPAHNGSFALRFDRSQNCVMTQTFNMAASGSLTFAFRPESNTNFRIRVRVNGSQVYYSNESAGTFGSWRIPATGLNPNTITIPSGTSTVSFEIDAGGEQFGYYGNVYIDSMSLTNVITETVIGDAGTDAITVNLASSDIDVATVPSTVVIPENELTAVVNVTGVAAGEATISVSYDTVTDDAELTVSQDTFVPNLIAC